jgi:hypothetical protein
MSGEEPKPAEDNSGASLFLAPDRGDRQIPGVPRRPHFILGGELTTIRREKPRAVMMAVAYDVIRVRTTDGTRHPFER